VASLSQGRTAAAQCGLFTYKSVPVIFEPPCTQTFILAGRSLRTDQETKDVVQDWLKGLLFRHFICTLYFCFNIEFYIVLNFVTFSHSGNSNGFILIGIPEVSLFLYGPIILSDMAYLNP